MPILLIAGLLAFRSRRNPRMQLSVLLVYAAGLISLGPYLSVDGRLSRVPLPDLVLSNIPLLNNLLPVRVSFEVDAFIAAVVAFGLDDVHRTLSLVPGALHTSQRMACIVCSLATLVLVVTQLPDWPYRSQLAPALPTAVRDLIPGDDPIAITYPYTGIFISTPMDWQAGSGFNFRLSGGYGLHPGATGTVAEWPNVMTPRGLQEFIAGETPPSVYGPPLAVTPGLVAETREALIDNDIRVVIVKRSVPNSGDVIDLFSQAIGPPQRAADGFLLWSSNSSPL